jgi:hypothetical protein
MPAAGQNHGERDDRYKWVALANTTAAVFMSVLDSTRAALRWQLLVQMDHLREPDLH